MTETAYHATVLPKEVLEILAPQPGEVFVDGTLGHGGHTLQILKLLGNEGLLIGLDRDPQMLQTARRRIESSSISSSSYRLIVADHVDLVPVVAEALAAAHVEPPRPHGLLLDLGPSTPQLQDPARGMSWRSEQALDMRMNPHQEGETALEIVNDWDEGELSRLFKEHADERWAKRIASVIVRERKQKQITTGRELGEVVAGAIPRKAWPPKIHPATRVFLALRIEVNREYETLDRIMPEAFDLLAPGGRMGIITFHSGEDRRVKRFMKEVCTAPEVPWPLPQGSEPAPAESLTRKPIGPGEEEMEANPHSRSAKLRAVRKLGERKPSS